MGYRRRFYFIDLNSCPERCLKADYDFWKKEFQVITLDPHEHIWGWCEKVINDFNVIVGYAL